MRSVFGMKTFPKPRTKKCGNYWPGQPDTISKPGFQQQAKTMNRLSPPLLQTNSVPIFTESVELAGDQAIPAGSAQTDCRPVNPALKPDRSKLRASPEIVSRR